MVDIWNPFVTANKQDSFIVVSDSDKGTVSSVDKSPLLQNSSKSEVIANQTQSDDKSSKGNIINNVLMTDMVPKDSLRNVK